MAVDGQGGLWMNGVGGERKRKDVDRWGKLWMVGMGILADPAWGHGQKQKHSPFSQRTYGDSGPVMGWGVSIFEPLYIDKEETVLWNMDLALYFQLLGYFQGFSPDLD